MRSARYVAPLAVVLVIAIAVTLLEGTPATLPAVALGSDVLLHALRAGALFAVVFILATVLSRASAGRLPSELSTSGIGYTAEETRKTTETLAELQEQVDDHQATIDRLAERIDRIGGNA